jgi:hypothetical protein
MLPEGWVPHCLALEPNSRRLVLTGYRSVGVRVAGVPHGAVFSQKQ